MKIAKVESYVLESPLERPFGWSQGWIDRRRTTILKITTDEGIVGWGEGGPAATIRDLFAPMLIGQDALNRVGLWERMYQSLYNANLAGGWGGNAIGAVDTALWDIAGKALQVPVHQLLGGRVRDRVAVYATGLYYTEGEFPNRLLAEAEGYVQAGFKGVKTKVGGLSLEEDVRRVAAIRRAIGPEIQLMVDANQAYNAATAIRIGQRLAEYDVLWFEEPVGAKDVDAYLQVKAALPMAIAGGECLRTRFEFKDFLARRALDIAQPDVRPVGGISELRNVALMANAFGIQVNPHVWDSPIVVAASLHVAAILPPCPPARVPRPYLQEPVMEFDQTPNAIRDRLITPAFQQVDGYLRVPTAPGLGVEVDEEALRRFAVAVI